MIAAAFLVLLYAGSLTWLAPPALERMTRSGITPRLGVAAWLVAVIGVIGAWIGALALVSVDAFRDGWHGAAVTFCLNILGFGSHVGLSQPLGSIVAIVVLGAACVVTVRTGGRIIGRIRLLRNHSRRHAVAARVIGKATEQRGVVVVSASELAAYCVPGRPPAIVVTTAVLNSLDHSQLAAVLAHERAHLAGRHHDLVIVLRALAASLPRLPLFTAAAEGVSRLLEMCADDAAARRHGSDSLLGGLITLVEGPPVTASALGVAHTAVLARAQRLAHPTPAHVQWRQRLIVGAAIGVTTALPIVAGLACQL